MNWREREFDEILRDELRQRGFYLVGSGPLEFAPMINGFKKHASVERYLSLESEDYRYVAYKNLGATVGFGENGEQVFTASLFIKIGSERCDPGPVTELTVFYNGRIYKYVDMCRDVYFRMGFVSSTEELKDLMNVIWLSASEIVQTWQRSIRTLVIEDRWPEEEYVSDVRFLEDDDESRLLDGWKNGMKKK